MEDTSYDVVVMGAGSTGENVAERVVKGGLWAAVIESGLVGGECSYSACMPSKALLRSGLVLEAARRVDGARQAITGAVLPGAVLARRTKFSSGWKDDSQVVWLKKRGIELIRGHARLVGEKRVEIKTPAGLKVLRAKHAVVVCTGSVPARPDIQGLGDAAVWTHIEATRATEVPRRLVILGGGAVGCEMAQAWMSLGSQVTLVVRGPRLLPRAEAFAGHRVAESLGRQGVKVRLDSGVTAVRRSEGTVQVTLASGETVEADEFLVAAGRRPRTLDMGLESVGLKSGDWLPVDDTGLVTGVSGNWLYAAGDVNHRALLTHMGKYQARACGDAIVARRRGDLGSAPPGDWSRWTSTADHRAVPQVVFTDPEVASVGLTEEEARARGLQVRAVEYDLGQVAGAALEADGYIGRARMVVDEARHVLVGATLVGQSVGELVHAATVAIVGEVPLERLWHAVPSYPTMSEIWLRLLETYGL